MALSDADLITRVIDHDDRHAFGELVRRHQSSVRALLRRLTGGDESLADDLAQEAFLRAFKGLRGYRGGARFSSWLYRIAYNVFLTARRRAPPDLRALLPEPPDERSAAASRADFRHDLKKALRDLSSGERAVLALAYGTQSTHEEIASILDCPLGTVKTNVVRAKEKLRRRLRSWAHAELA